MFTYPIVHDCDAERIRPWLELHLDPSVEAAAPSRSVVDCLVYFVVD
jgi:hypothetical protein